jgi:hypothetical protein
MPTPTATSGIVSQAFRLMEMSPPSSFADDSAEATAAAEQYPVALNICLEANDWSFASVLALLPEIDDLPDGVAADADLPHTFAIPADCLILHQVGDINTRWRRDREMLRADDPGPLTVRYTATITNETALPATFKTAVAYQLAALLGARFVGTAAMQQTLFQSATATLRQAMARDRGQASQSRWDGGPMQGDWATEAQR